MLKFKRRGKAECGWVGVGGDSDSGHICSIASHFIYL